MNIVVCVKQVPDTWAERKLKSDDKTLDRDSVDGVMNELDEYAVEEALRIKEAARRRGDGPDHGPGQGGGDDPQGAVDGRRQGRPRASTTRCTAPTRCGTSLRAGRRRSSRSGSTWSSWARSRPTRGWASMAAMLAERLGLPQLTLARKVDGRRDADQGPIGGRPTTATTTVEASLPAVVSAWSRRSTSRATRRSRASWRPRRSRSTTLSLADAGIDAGQVGLDARRHRGRRLRRRGRRGRRARSSRTRATAAPRLAEFLAPQKFI